VNIQLNIVTCPTYPEKLKWDNVVASSLRLQVVIVTLPGLEPNPRCADLDFSTLTTLSQSTYCAMHAAMQCIQCSGYYLWTVSMLLCVWEQKCHVTEQEVHNALLSGDQQDQLVIAYHLVLDNNRIADEADKLQIHDFFVASSPPVESFMVVSSRVTHASVWRCVLLSDLYSVFGKTCATTQKTWKVMFLDFRQKRKKVRIVSQVT